MKIHQQKHRLAVTQSDLSGSVFVNSRLQGMTIDGIEVTELLAAWKERQGSQEGAKA